MSVYNDLLNGMLTTIQGLSLPGIPTSSINITKLPKAEEKIDVLPCICICPRDEPEEVIHSGFNQAVTVVYGVEVVIIAPGNLDLSGDDWSTYLGWRETIRSQFQQAPFPAYTNTGSTYLWNVQVKLSNPIDRYRVSELYDYMSLTVKFSVSEISVG